MSVLSAIAGTNLDGIEGSSIPGGCHAARYGGGDEYCAVDPLLSFFATSLTPSQHWSNWAACEESLAALRADTLQWPHGYSDAGLNLLPDGAAPPAASLSWSPIQLLVTRAPPPCEGGSSGGEHFSLMLHGWLFGGFGASSRKAHQKFPLLAIWPVGDGNLASPEPDAGPEWLRVDGSFGWADQHVHRDEPVDLGGFMFAEAFVGADMARIRPRDHQRVTSLWLAAIDIEARAGLLTLCVVVPRGFPPEAEEALRRGEMTATAAGIAAALGKWLPPGEDSNAVIAAVAGLSQGDNS